MITFPLWFAVNLELGVMITIVTCIVAVSLSFIAYLVKIPALGIRYVCGRGHGHGHGYGGHEH